MDAAEGGPEGFAALVETSTDEIVPEAWGGHFDAGDWDRRIPHLSYLRAALDLVELYPETWATLELGIPESGNNIPDVIDEGLWDLDMYRRLQLPDGGIRGGIESEEHPEPGDTSWTQTQQVFVFAPDARSSYIYARCRGRDRSGDRGLRPAAAPTSTSSPRWPRCGGPRPTR